MPRQLDQLPADTTTLARKVAALEREVKELRAARRLTSATAGLIRTAASGPRIELDGSSSDLNVYGGSDGSTLIAQAGPDTSGGGGWWARGFQAPYNLTSFMGGGVVSFRTVDDGVIASNAGLLYVTDGSTYADMVLTSGAIGAADKRAILILETLAGGAAPSAYITGDGTTRCNMDVDGILTAGNFAWGQVSITPTTANVPASVNVTGLNLQGTTFLGYAVAQTTVPGSQVTGASATNVTSTGLTVWVTRTSASATFVNWLVIGI